MVYSRQTWGGEFLIPWGMRDRGATEFSKYLEIQRRNGIKSGNARP